MNVHRIPLAAAALALSASLAVAAPRNPTPQSPYAADFVGTWERVGSTNFDPNIPGSEPDRPPLTPKAAVQYKASLDSRAAGKPTNDPHARCIPLGMPRMMNMVYLMEILVAPDKVTVIAEEQSQVRRLWTDGRGYPEDLYPTYVGSSVAHWEGPVLVVETVSVRTDIPINRSGLMHSDKLKVVERLWLEDNKNTIKNQITLTDPEIFSEPWTVTKTYKRTTDAPMEYVCQENNRNPVGADGTTGVVLAGQ